MSSMFVILCLFSGVRSTTVGKIDDYMMVGNISKSLFNITREQCVCELVWSPDSLFTANYVQADQTCQLFDSNYSLILITPDRNTSFLFLNRSSLLIETVPTHRAPVSSLATVTALNFETNTGSSAAQGDGLVDRANATSGVSFNSGGYPPQYIQLELPGQYNITRVCLLVNQTPAGITVHHLRIGSNPSNLTLASNLTGSTASWQWINLTYNPPLTSVRFLRLETLSSPSWVAWYKFIVYDY